MIARLVCSAKTSMTRSAICCGRPIGCGSSSQARSCPTVTSRAGPGLGDLPVEVGLPVVAEHEVLLMLLAEPQRVGDLPHDRALASLDHDPVLGVLDRPADLGMHLPQVSPGDLGGEARMRREVRFEHLVLQTVETLAQPGACGHARLKRPGRG